MIFKVHIEPHAKERPRFGRGRVYMSPAYRAWQAKFRALAQFYLKDAPAISVPCAGLVSFVTPSGNMRPDTDNAVAAVWDAMQPHWITNDKLIRRCAYAVFKGAETSIAVCLDPL